MGIHVTILMVSGEIIAGELIKQNSLYVYVQNTLEYDEQAIALFGKEYCDSHPTQILQLPLDEIVCINLY